MLRAWRQRGFYVSVRMAFGSYVTGILPCGLHCYQATPAGFYINYGLKDPSSAHGVTMVNNLENNRAELRRRNAKLRAQIATLEHGNYGLASAMRLEAPPFGPGISPSGVIVDRSLMKERRQRLKALNRKVAPKRLKCTSNLNILSPSASTDCSSGCASEEDRSPALGACRSSRAHLRVTFASEVEVIMDA